MSVNERWHLIICPAGAGNSVYSVLPKVLAEFISAASAAKPFYLIDLSGSDDIFSVIPKHQFIQVKNFHFRAPQIDTASCRSCGKCSKACSRDVISFVRGSHPVVSRPDKCVDCGHCYKSCPAKKAIERQKVQGGVVARAMLQENVFVFRIISPFKSLMRGLAWKHVIRQLPNHACVLVVADVSYAGKKLISHIQEHAVLLSSNS